MLGSCLTWRRRVFFSLTVFLGLGQTVSSTTTAANCASTGSTSSSLSNSIPSCALSCVEEFIQTQYTAGTCCETDIACLCRTNTTSGLTLGESALACIVGSCSADILSTSGSGAYEICSDISGALPETHGAITATKVSVVTETTHLATTTAVSSSAQSTSTLPTSTLATSTSDGTTSITSAPITATATAATTLPITTLATFPSQSTVTLGGHSPIPSATIAALSSSALSSSAVIGVSIASGVSTIFLILVAILLCGRRLRRKRQKKEEASQSFEIGGEMSEPPGFGAGPAPQTLSPMQLSNYPQTMAEDEYSGAHFQQFPSQPVARQQQGPLFITNGAAHDQAAMSPETEYNGSPQSQTSQRTLSRLLPERVAVQGIGIVPEPLRVIRQPPVNSTIRVVDPPARPASEATVFDEDEQQSNTMKEVFGPPLDKTRRISQRSMARGASPMRVVGLPAGPRAMLPPLQTRPQQNMYGENDSPGYYSYKWDKEAALVPGQSRPGTQQYYNNGNTPIQRNFSRLGSAQRSLTTPTKTNTLTPWSRNTNGYADSSYETIMVEDDWGMNERSKLSVPSQLPRQSQQAQQPRLSPVSERLALPSNSPRRYPAIPRSAAAAIVPATEQDMRKSHVAEVYYDNNTRHTANMPLPATNTNPNSSNTSMVYELGPGQRSRSASPSPSVNSSLLAKRRGESVADKMESQFRSGVQPKPALSRKVVTTSSGSSQEENSSTRTSESSLPMPKKHNITPTRRGDDLYLRVD